MDSRKLARLCQDLAENKKAEGLVILDVRKLTSIADYFVVATGTSEPHLRAIMDEIIDKLRQDYKLRASAIDGTLQTSWVVLDYGSVIIHLMKSDIRHRYGLEALWGDAPRVRRRKASPRASK